MKKAILGVFAIATMVISCNKVKDAVKGAEAMADAVENAANPVALLSSTEELQKAEDALKAMPKYKDKEVRVFQNVNFYGGDYPRIVIELINPENGEDVDHYEYQNGKWSAPQPVQISGGGGKAAMKANSTPLKDIKFATVATVFNNWKEKAASLEGVTEKETDFIYFSLWVPNQTREWTSTDIETTRAKYDIEFNMDGSVKSFEKK